MTYSDEAYPPLLREIYDPPVLLWVLGDIDVLRSAGIAVVGTRRATQYGKDSTRKLCRSLVEKGLTITSGLALGIDTEAHKAALEGGGKTIAVLGSGIDVLYPRKNTRLARDIIANGGAVITEFPMGTPPDAGNFPMRNRIVSGLSLGTLVVESGLKGGSMITAQSALTQNREVFVVPHALSNSNGVGCNHLIKQGAGKLVQTAEDILDELPRYHHPANRTEQASSPTATANWKEQDLDHEEEAICKLLEDGPLHIDAMSQALGVSVHRLLSTLLPLEMKACVRQKAGRTFELL